MPKRGAKRSAKKDRFVDISLLGDERLAKILRKAPLKIQTKAMRPALRAGAKIVRNSARQKVPVDTGALRKSIKVRALAKRSRNKIGVVVSAGTRYAAMQEFGWQDGGKHAGTPFLRPSLRDNKTAVMSTIKRELRKRLFAELRKLKQAEQAKGL